MSTQFDDFLVNLFTEDIEATAEFYRHLGFRDTFRTPPDGAPTHVEVRSGGLTIGVSSLRIVNDEFGLGAVADAASGDLTLWVDDVDAAFGAAMQAGGTVVRRPAELLDGRLRKAWVRDPSGHLLGLVQHTESR